MVQVYSTEKLLWHTDTIDALRAKQQPSPKHVQLVISDLCNQNCGFCAYRMEGYISNQLFGVRDSLTGIINNNPNRQIEFSKVIEILDDCKKIGVKAIQITGGGEPTVHPKHREIFMAVLDRQLELGLVTNGAILRRSDKCTPDTSDILLNAKWVRISIDAATAATYSKIREVSEQIFHRVIRNISTLVQRKQRQNSSLVIGIGFVVTKQNWREIEDAAKMAKSLGVDNVRISAVFQPDGATYFSEFYEKALAASTSAEKLSTRDFHVVNNFGHRLEDLQQESPNYSFCAYQHFTTYIGADLNVYRCCNTSYNLRGLIGSLKTQRFKTLWESQEKRSKFVNFDARQCERCQFNRQNRSVQYAIESAPAHVNFV